MSSKKGIGIPPLIMGIMLAGQSLPQLLQNGLSLWTVSSLIGGCAAVVVGLGILLEWREFSTETTEPHRSSTITLLGLAVLSVAGGVILTFI